MGLDPDISTLSDFIKSMFLVLYNQFQTGETIHVTDGTITSYYIVDYEYKNVLWNKVPSNGDYRIKMKKNSRYYIRDDVYFEFAKRPVEYQALSKSTHDALFNPWKTFLENKHVDFHLNTKIISITKTKDLYCLSSKDNKFYCKHLIMANGFQSIDHLLKNVVSKELYNQINLSVSTTIIATTCSEIKNAYAVLIDSGVIFSYQILNKVFIESNDVPKGKCKVFFNIHCIVNETDALTLPKKISELNLQEFKDEMIFNLKILCKKDNIELNHIDYVAVSDEVIFDGVKVHTKKDNGYFITKTSKHLLKPMYDELPNIYFAGHDVYNSINVRSIESACESGKNAAKNILQSENIPNDIIIYKMEKIETLYDSVTQNIYLFILFILLIVLSIYSLLSKKIYAFVCYIFLTYVLLCFYQLLVLLYDYTQFI